MIEDENATALTESGASDHLAADLRAVLIGRYVDHLRQVGMEQLKRAARAKPAAPLAQDPARPRFKAPNHGIDPAEIAAMEARLAEHVQLVERRIFDDTCLDDLEQEFGIAKERLRQTAKRAAKTIADLAAAEPRFADELSRKLPQRRRSAKAEARPAAAPTASCAATALADASANPIVTIVPDQHAAHNRLTSVVAITPAADATLADATLAEATRGGASLANGMDTRLPVPTALVSETLN